MNQYSITWSYNYTITLHAYNVTEALQRAIEINGDVNDIISINLFK